jgi:hypothetical protein
VLVVRGPPGGPADLAKVDPFSLQPVEGVPRERLSGWSLVQTAGDYAYLGLGSRERQHEVPVVDARTSGWVVLVSET